MPALQARELLVFCGRPTKCSNQEEINSPGSHSWLCFNLLSISKIIMKRQCFSVIKRSRSAKRSVCYKFWALIFYAKAVQPAASRLNQNVSGHPVGFAQIFQRSPVSAGIVDLAMFIGYILLRQHKSHTGQGFCSHLGTVISEQFL